MCCGLHSENAWIPNGLCVHVFYVGKGSIFGNSPEYKGDSTQILREILLSVGLLGDLSPMCRSWLGLGHDSLLPDINLGNGSNSSYVLSNQDFVQSLVFQ